MTAIVAPEVMASPSRTASSEIDARLVGGDLVLHLHRLDDADELALLDRLPLLDEHLPHVALERGDERVAARAAAARAPDRSARRGRGRVPVPVAAAAGAAPLTPGAAGGPMTLTSKRRPETSTV